MPFAYFHVCEFINLLITLFVYYHFERLGEESELYDLSLPLYNAHHKKGGGGGGLQLCLKEIDNKLLMKA